MTADALKEARVLLADLLEHCGLRADAFVALQGGAMSRWVAFFCEWDGHPNGSYVAMAEAIEPEGITRRATIRWVGIVPPELLVALAKSVNLTTPHLPVNTKVGDVVTYQDFEDINRAMGELYPPGQAEFWLKQVLQSS